jgi:hypothetical protein
MKHVSTISSAFNAMNRYDLSPEQSELYVVGVDQSLREKRKLRQARACYPCRRRKVKCNFQIPCETCLTRDHPELCTAQPNWKLRRAERGRVTLEPRLGVQSLRYLATFLPPSTWADERQ